MKRFIITAALILGPMCIFIAMFGIVKFTMISMEYSAGDMNLAALFFTVITFNVLILLIRASIVAWNVAGNWLKK